MTGNRLIRAAFVLSVLAAAAACGDDGGGDDATGATCEEYCDQMAVNCAGTNAQWPTRDQCLAACGAFPPGTPGDQSGNSLECRVYHAGAALGDPDTHCVHAGPGGAGLCGSNCEGFCTIVVDACTGGNEAYASVNQCITECQGFDDSEPYDVSDTVGDTLACRIYHGIVATADPGTHCPHTLPVSDTCN